ncbi:MAG: DUF2752 domain-containing protein [Phycisphaerales bacterium]|nr:DUF2752 domain-containing protein [Phycisphaerales bacterium]
MAGTIAGEPGGDGGPGPVRRVVARRRGPVGFGERCLALALCAACVVLLSVAAWLRPSPEGHGTHEQLGLPPCAWAEAFGKPCATCGMTTAFACAAHGDLVGSARVQPFGFLLSLLVAATAWGAGHVAATGSRLGESAVRLLTPRVAIGLVGLLLAAWAYKMVTWQG